MRHGLTAISLPCSKVVPTVDAPLNLASVSELLLHCQALYCLKADVYNNGEAFRHVTPISSHSVVAKSSPITTAAPKAQTVGGTLYEHDKHTVRNFSSHLSEPNRKPDTFFRRIPRQRVQHGVQKKKS